MRSTLCRSAFRRAALLMVARKRHLPQDQVINRVYEELVWDHLHFGRPACPGCREDWPWAIHAPSGVIDIDGGRVLFDDGWGLVRASNTQPVLVLRAEARTAARLDQITQTLGAALARFPEVGPVRW